MAGKHSVLQLWKTANNLDQRWQILLDLTTLNCNSCCMSSNWQAM